MAEEFEERKNTGRMVVAVPTATEPVHHIGDPAEPKHVSLVWLGTPEENPDLDVEAVAEAVRTAAERIGPITSTVESQGPLGDDGAQVMFLGGDEITKAHDELLRDPTLNAGAAAVKQFPEFNPHLTLGYEPSVAVSEDDLPEEVIFDRLALWDGDEHTEFPLAPSASTEENTAGPEVVDEIVASFARHVDDPLVVRDAATLATACAQADALGDEGARAATQRVLMRRARALGCQHVIPTAWLRRATAVVSSNVAATAATSVNVSDVPPDLFKLKTQLSTLSDTALRAAYMRGVREYTMTAPQSRPPLPRDVIAQARVNSLIRLAQGDLSARTDDQDLLS